MSRSTRQCFVSLSALTQVKVSKMLMTAKPTDHALTLNRHILGTRDDAWIALLCDRLRSIVKKGVTLVLVVRYDCKAFLRHLERVKHLAPWSLFDRVVGNNELVMCRHPLVYFAMPLVKEGHVVAIVDTDIDKFEVSRYFVRSTRDEYMYTRRVQQKKRTWNVGYTDPRLWLRGRMALFQTDRPNGPISAGDVLSITAWFDQHRDFTPDMNMNIDLSHPPDAEGCDQQFCNAQL